MSEEERKMKDAEQDRRLKVLEDDVTAIKSVTHANPLMGWQGVVKEHKILMESVNTLTENSEFTKKLHSSLMNTIKTITVILSLVITGVAAYNLFF